MTTGEFGTFLATAVALILAVFGDWLRLWVTGPRLKLVLENDTGSLLSSTKILYQLNVVNRPWRAGATNCRVQVKTLWQRMSNGEFVQIKLPYPLWMTWPPSEYRDPTITVLREERVDFGALEKGEFFFPAARVIPENMRKRLQLQPGQTIRYGLAIVSDQFASRKLQVFEVSWNGEWTDNLDGMPKNLKIREVEG